MDHTLSRARGWLVPAMRAVSRYGTRYLEPLSTSTPPAPTRPYAHALALPNLAVLRSRRRRYAAPLARRQRRALPWKARAAHAGPHPARPTKSAQLIRHPDWAALQRLTALIAVSRQADAMPGHVATGQLWPFGTAGLTMTTCSRMTTEAARAPHQTAAGL